MIYYRFQILLYNCNVVNVCLLFVLHCYNTLHRIRLSPSLHTYILLHMFRLKCLLLLNTVSHNNCLQTLKSPDRRAAFTRQEFIELLAKENAADPQEGISIIFIRQAYNSKTLHMYLSKCYMQFHVRIIRRSQCGV